EHAAGPAIEIPRAPGADMVVQRSRGVLRQDAQLLDAGVAAVAEDEVDDAVLAAERDRADRTLRGQHAEALAATTRQHQPDELGHRILPGDRRLGSQTERNLRSAPRRRQPTSSTPPKGCGLR